MIENIPEHTSSIDPAMDFPEYIATVVKVYNQYLKSTLDLQRIMMIEPDSPSEVMVSAIRTFITDRIDGVNENSNNRSSAKVSIFDLAKPFCEHSYGFSTHETIEQAAAQALQVISVSELSKTLKAREKVIECEGFKASANELGETFGLIGRTRPGTFEIKKVKGKVLIQLRATGSGYDRTLTLRELIPHIKTFEAETGSTGTLRTFKALHDEQSRYIVERGNIASGYIVNSLGEVTIKVFKEHWNVYLDESVFEALYGFIKSYKENDRFLLDVA